MSSGSGQVVCFETFRREREGRRARVLPYLAPQSATGKSPFRGIELSGREIEHRRQMLRHLAEEQNGTGEEVPFAIQ